jgi:hypothetical protein
MEEVLETHRYDFLMERRVSAGEAIGDFINNAIERLFELFSFDMPFIISNEATGLIAVVFSFIAVVVTSVAIYVFIRTRMNSRHVIRHNLEDIFEEMKHHTVTELLELSNKANDKRVAVRYKYIAVILSLNERNTIVIEPSATNAVILKQIKAAAPEFAIPFSNITEVFHYTWFGHKNLKEESFNDFNSTVNKVIQGE